MIISGCPNIYTVMQINYIITAIVVTGIVTAGIYFLRKRNVAVPIEKKTMDKLTLFYVNEYFRQNITPLEESCTPVVLKATQEDVKKLNISLQEQMNAELSYYILTYYNMKREEVLTDYMVVVETKSIDSNLSEAFGGKDMLILE